MQRINSLSHFLISIFISVILLAGCNSKSAPDPSSKGDPKGDSSKGNSKNGARGNPPTIVDVIIATPQTVTNEIEANGTVIANESVDLHPEVTGRLTYLNVPEGKKVTKGTVLARINSADLQAQVQKSKAQLDLAETNQRRLKVLLDAGGVNQTDYDAVVNQVAGYKSDIAYNEALIDKTIIRAPFTGTLGLRQVSPGAYVSSASIIATLQELGKSKIDFTLPEEYANIVKVGDTVGVEMDMTPDVRQKATVIALEPQAVRQTRNIIVRAVLAEAVANPGAYVKVYIGGKNASKKAIMVPTNAIIPDDKNNQLVVVKQGKATFVNVQTGLRSENDVEITKGIKPGDTVVVTGVLFARPKAPLKVRSVKSLKQLDAQ